MRAARFVLPIRITLGTNRTEMVPGDIEQCQSIQLLVEMHVQDTNVLISLLLRF
jgi:hypothetical protein